jgi:LPXTG-site transpeptidase (sortase) family protein
MIRRFFALLLVLVGFGVLVVSALALFWSDELQGLYTSALPRIGAVSGAGDRTAVRKAEPGTPIGMIEIPRLGLSSVVLEGDDAAALLLGVGHLADTPLPWHGGNSVLAAHRDTFFRPLAGIRRNDVIRFSTADAEFEYVVKETMIVDPTDVEVLDPTTTATLTLITCYPFDYVGPAPSRFIVRAERRS